MATLVIKLATSKTQTTLVRDFATGKLHTDLNNCSQELQNCLSGLLGGTAKVGVEETGTKASQTFTFASIADADTLTIGGVVFTCKNSGATGDQFNKGASDTAAATAAAAAINASTTAGIPGVVTAAAVGAVLTITAAEYGKSGHGVTTVGGTHVTAGGTRLAGGVATTFQTYQR